MLVYAQKVQFMHKLTSLYKFMQKTNWFMLVYAQKVQFMHKLTSLCKFMHKLTGLC